jgi:hypothetical protein
LAPDGARFFAGRGALNNCGGVEKRRMRERIVLMAEAKIMATTEKKPFLAEKLPTLIAVTTVVLAVCATLAAFKAAGYGNRMVLAQSQASDQWAYYQAKSIKETAYQVERDAMVLAAEQAVRPEGYLARIAEYDKEVARYKTEKKEIMEDAKRLEHERDMAQNLNSRFGQAMIFLL